MNLTEIKNATRNDLIEYLEAYGLRVSPDTSKKLLRSEAMEIYWETNNNNGFSCQTVEGIY